jgi:hypothetical protein
LVACLFPHPGRPDGGASHHPQISGALLTLHRLYLQIMTDHAAQSLMKEFGPAIERWVAHDPGNPDALEALAWLIRLRLKIRRTDPRNYVGRKLPDCLTQLL